jgi:O-antigen/teichoic acid export membrane protein
LPEPRFAFGAVLWSYLAQFLNLTAGVITLPVLFLYLTPEQVQLWVVFITLGSLALLFELGFQPTLARNLAYVLSGSRSVLNKGLAIEATGEEGIDSRLLADLVLAGRQIYLRLALALGALFVPASFLYLIVIAAPASPFDAAIVSWAMFSLGLVLNFYFSYMTGMLLGAQEVAGANQVTVVTRLVFIAISVILVVLGFGILSLGIANLCACVCGRAMAFVRVRQVVWYRAMAGDASRATQLRRRLTGNALRLGASQLGAFATQRGNILLAAAVLSVEASTAYSLSVTALMAIYGIALAAPQAALPFLGQAAQQQDREGSARLLGAALLLSYGTFILGFIAFLLVALWVATEGSFPVHFLSPSALLVFGVIIFLELNHSIFGLFITASNHVPFYKAALLSGAAILSFSAVLVGELGVWSLILVQGGVQLAYNNWRWPLAVMRSGGLSYRTLLSAGLAQLRLMSGRASGLDFR